MKEIKAIFRPIKLLDVLAELHKIEGLPGITISDIRGIGKRLVADAKELSTDGLIEFIHQTKIELVVPDEMVDQIIRTIQKYAHTGNPGDGKIFIYTVDNCVKIRTNEQGLQAI